MTGYSTLMIPIRASSVCPSCSTTQHQLVRKDTLLSKRQLRLYHFPSKTSSKLSPPSDQRQPLQGRTPITLDDETIGQAV